MKQVWILEKFADADEMRKTLDKFIENLEMLDKSSMSAEKIKEISDTVKHMQATIEENPNGRWYGFEGKENYKNFIEVARGAMRRHPDAKFRVVKAEIPDDERYWLNYKNAVENEGVLRYLLATK